MEKTDSIELHDGGRGYIPSVTIDVPISSQNKLEWSKNSLETWGLDKDVKGARTGLDLQDQQQGLVTY